MGAEPHSVGVAGTGLIGTSVALALRARGVEVLLSDRDPASVALAADLGAGRPWNDSEPVDLAVVAVPPDHVAATVADIQRRGVARVCTDVASVKVRPLLAAEEHGCDLGAYVPGHPLAGRETSGPAAARADLFLGRPWAICPTGKTGPDAVACVRALIELCGANAVEVDAAAHDRAVALVSHAPHVTSAAVAARLVDAPEVALGLAGQGVRDVTRIAGSDPALWMGILGNNAGPVADILDAVAGDLSATAHRLREMDDAAPGAADGVADLLRRGNTGRGRIPGKHGGPQREFAVVPVVIGDKPGELARIFAAAGETAVNIEDVALEHSPGLPAALVQLSVRPEHAATLAAALREQGFNVH
jgi:prephenate dehydrogenase